VSCLHTKAMEKVVTRSSAAHRQAGRPDDHDEIRVGCQHWQLMMSRYHRFDVAARRTL